MFLFALENQLKSILEARDTSHHDFIENAEVNEPRSNAFNDPGTHPQIPYESKEKITLQLHPPGIPHRQLDPCQNGIKGEEVNFLLLWDHWKKKKKKKNSAALAQARTNPISHNDGVQTAERQTTQTRRASSGTKEEWAHLHDICGAERSPDAKLIKEWCRSTTWGQRRRRVRWPTTKRANAALMFWRHKHGGGGGCYSP